MNTNQKKALYESIMKQVAITVKNTLNEAAGKPNKKDIYPNKPFSKVDIHYDYKNTYTFATCEIFIDIRNVASAKDWRSVGYTGNFIEACELEYNLQGDRSYGDGSLVNSADIEELDEDLFSALQEYIDDGPLTDFSNFLRFGDKDPDDIFDPADSYNNTTIVSKKYGNCHAYMYHDEDYVEYLVVIQDSTKKTIYNEFFWEEEDIEDGETYEDAIVRLVDE